MYSTATAVRVSSDSRPTSRICRGCKKSFRPFFSNQQMHPDCRKLFRREYNRKYQQKLRRNMKSGLED